MLTRHSGPGPHSQPLPFSKAGSELSIGRSELSSSWPGIHCFTSLIWMAVTQLLPSLGTPPLNASLKP